MTTWRIKTNNQPLAASRRFLKSVWAEAKLNGMVLPVQQPDQYTIRSGFIESPDDLNTANPFAPLTLANAGKLVAELSRQRPGERFAAVMRACELRGLSELIKHESINIGNWLIIGVDCLACFPASDFAWRVQKAGGVEPLTDLVIRNARQGGISLSRFRLSCQMCSKPEPIQVDLCLGLLGLPVKESILVIPGNDSITDQLHLSMITDGLAPSDLVSQHDRVMTDLNGRRQHFRDRLINDLPADLPSTLDELTEFLKGCTPCQACITACPMYDVELAPLMANGAVTRDAVHRWLEMCADCGMCEQTCPKEIPLAAVMTRITHNLRSEAVAV
jgi:formate dehydrogenase (coenzyme F420) beta subunit